MRSTFSGIILPLSVIMIICLTLTLNALPISAEGSVVDVAVTNVVPNKRTVGEDMPMKFNVTLQNQGDHEITVNVTIYVNASRVVEIENVTLAQGDSKTLVATWRASVQKGYYTISANTTVLDGETDVADNTYVDERLFVTLVGDINGNRVVNIFDIVIMAGAYGTSPPDPRYHPVIDIDDDGYIDIFDIIPPIGIFGRSW